MARFRRREIRTALEFRLRRLGHRPEKQVLRTPNQRKSAQTGCAPELALPFSLGRKPTGDLWIHLERAIDLDPVAVAQRIVGCAPIGEYTQPVGADFKFRETLAQPGAIDGVDDRRTLSQTQRDDHL